MIDGYISLSDDETSNEIQTNSLLYKLLSKNNNEYNGEQQSGSIETIVIDEELSQRSDKSTNNNKDTPDTDTNTTDTVHKPIVPIPYCLNAIYKENRYFANFVEKCLELENSDGMTRIINRALIGSYEQSEKSYRDSPEFKKVMLKALNRLEVDPEHKFSHVKDLVETLKLHRTKKRVQLTTLATNLKGNSTGEKCIKNGRSIVIDLDSEERDGPIISLDDEQNNVIVLDEDGTEEKENKNTQNKDDTGEKENKNIQNGSQENNFLMPQIEMVWGSSIEIKDDVDDRIGQVLPIEYEPESSEPNVDREKITHIELEIAHLKKMINEFEEIEVVDDTVYSPYIMCEKYKARVVALYKELCKLTGSDAVKRRQVRLQVLEGHPAGPVRRLEKFINDNIGEDGMPLFPDFCDVIQCVMAANLEDRLGWPKKLVMREATSLFTQCGRALQKQRQRREYRDLLANVKEEQTDYDPADEDPELQARLEANRRIAVKKETDLLERYTHLQYLPPETSNPMETEPASPVSNLPPETSNPMETEVATPTIDDDSYIIEDSDEDSNFEPPVPLLAQHEDNLSTDHDKTDSTEASKENNVNKELEVKVKPEPMDIVQMLEDLGDNFTSTVIDIEDPFLVIEIDSSDDEDSTDNIKNDGVESNFNSTYHKNNGIEIDLTAVIDNDHDYVSKPDL